MSMKKYVLTVNKKWMPPTPHDEAVIEYLRDG
jgi:hypothetical protein